MSARRGERIRRLFGLGLWGPEADQGLEWEIEHHIEECADALEAEGLGREEALAEARRRFGDVAAVRRELRAVRRGEGARRKAASWLETLWQDVRYGGRGILHHPGFAAGLVATLGLGIGSMVAVFSIVDALLLRPLPYASPERLVHVGAAPPGSEHGLRYLPVDLVREWLERDEVFAGMLPHQRGSALLTGGLEPEGVVTHRVGASFEEVLGVYPIHGRGLLPDDAVRGAAPVALMSHQFWRSRFGGDAGVVGRSVLLDGTPHTVIGVMPPGFKFPEYSHTEFWVPLALAGDIAGNHVELVARVEEQGIPAAQAASAPLAAGLFEGRPGLDSATVQLTGMEERRGGYDELQQATWLLFGAVGLILLVAAANGFNLLLVRSADRGRELAVRRALGASRARVVRQLMTETLGLALLSGGVAVAIALAATRGLQGMLPDSLVFFLPHAIEVEQRALTVAFLLALATGTVLGLLPALVSTRPTRSATREGLTPYASHTPARSRLRRGLVVAEVTMAIILLTGAGLLLNSFVRLTRVDIGVDTENVALLTLSVTQATVGDSAVRSTFLPTLEERIRAIPGVEAATATGHLPSSMLFFGTALQAEGRDPPGRDPDMLPSADVSADFFDVLGARLIAGRPFRRDETPGDDVAIIDRDLARYLWGGEDPLGRRFRVREDGPWLTVVGVVGDLLLEARDGSAGDFVLLYPFDSSRPSGYHTVAIRTAGDPTSVFPAVRAAVRELAPDQPISELTLAAEVYAEDIQMPRFLAFLVGVLGAFGLILAAVGVFSVLAYEVAQRAREIGVRMALGATAGEMQRLVVRQGLLLTALGAAIGLAAVLVLSRYLRGMLFELEPTDPATLAAVVATMLLVAAAASLVPARRTTRVDPAEAIRAE